MVVEQSPKKILIIDDDKNIILALKYYLSIEGYEVHAAANGKHAFQILNENPPDLILLDVKMPVMNGYLFAQLVKSKEKFKSIPIIMITATVNMTGGIQLHSHVDDILKKPFENEELLKKLSKYLS